MARRTKEEAEATKKAISIATLEIFCEKGYSRTTFDEIAKRINLTKGAVYWHFRNKADILSEIIRKTFEITRNIIAIKVPKIDSLEQLKQYMHEELKLIENNPEYRQCLYFVFHQMEWSEAILNKVSTDVKSITDFNKEQIKKALKNEQESKQIKPELNIEDIIECIDGLWMSILRNIVIPGADFNEFKRLLDVSFEIVLNGITTKGTN